jgi:hypothetical protein
MGLAMLLLTACHHDNPLQSHSKKQSLLFLINASANAEKRLNLPIKDGDRGVVYWECMGGEKDKDINCNALYQAMIDFAKEGHCKAYENLTLGQLTDTTVFKGLDAGYLDALVDTWPTYY